MDYWRTTGLQYAISYPQKRDMERSCMKRKEMMPLEYPLKVKVGVALAALLSLWGTFEHFAIESAHQERYRDPYEIAAQFSRFADFRAAVPEKAILGYITDIAPGSVTADAMFNGAQYVLAPRILRKSTEGYDLVLGNFTRPGDFVAIGRQHRLNLERDFGSGVVLFRKEAR
jgi:hypothetical protein